MRLYNVANNGEKENDLRTENANLTVEDQQEKISVVDAAMVSNG